ncbi:MAG: peptidoglycan-binding domain-containing protein [Pseudomonadota bacterium]
MQHMRNRLGFLGVTGILLAAQGCASLPHESGAAPKGDSPPPLSAPKGKPVTAAKAEPPRVESVIPPAPLQAPPTSAENADAACWAQATIYPMRTVTPLEIVTRDAVNDIQLRPAVLRPEQRSYIVRQGAKTYRVEAPTYKQVREQELVRPEVRRSVVVPAVFDTKEERIEVESERKLLVPCVTPGAKKSRASTSRSLCTQIQPARYQTLTRKTLVSPETLREEVEPAVYKTVTRWVVDQPARVVEIELPEKTASIEVQYLAKPEQIDEKQMPPHIVNIEQIRYSGMPMPVWRQAPCPGQLDEDLIKQLQNALNNAGHASGEADGKLGKKTLQAVFAYQREQGLASGALTLETLHKLGALPVK